MYKIELKELNKLINVEKIFMENDIPEDFLNNIDEKNDFHLKIEHLIFNSDEINLTLLNKSPHYDNLHDLIASILIDNIECEIYDTSLVQILNAEKINHQEIKNDLIDWEKVEKKIKKANEETQEKIIEKFLENFLKSTEEEQKNLLYHFHDDQINEFFLEQLFFTIKKYNIQKGTIYPKSFLENEKVIDYIIKTKNIKILNVYAAQYWDLDESGSKYNEPNIKKIINFINSKDYFLLLDNYLENNSELYYIEILEHLFQKHNLVNKNFNNIKKHLIKNIKFNKKDFFFNILNEEDLTNDFFINDYVIRAIKLEFSYLKENQYNFLKCLIPKIKSDDLLILFLDKFNNTFYKEFKTLDFLKLINKNLLENEKVIEACIDKNYKVYHTLNPNLKLNKKLYFTYLRKTQKYKTQIINFNQISDELLKSLTMPEWVESLSYNNYIKENPYFQKNIINDNKFLIHASKYWGFLEISDEKIKQLLNDIDNAKKIISDNRHIYKSKNFPIKFKKDPFFSSFYYRYCDKSEQEKILSRFKNNKNFYLHLVESSTFYIRIIPDEFKKDKDFVFKILDILNSPEKIKELTNYNFVPKQIMNIIAENKIPEKEIVSYLKSTILNIKIESSMNKNSKPNNKL